MINEHQRPIKAPLNTIIPNLHEHLQWVPVIYVLALAELRYVRVKRDERVGRAQVKRVVDAPVDLFLKEGKNK